MADLFDRLSGSGALSGHTTDSGDAWASGATKVSLSGGSAYSNNASQSNGTQPVSAWTPPGTDYEVGWVVGADWVTGASKGGTQGIMARAAGSQGSLSYYVLLGQSSAGFGNTPDQYAVLRVDAGNGGTVLGTIQTFSPPLAANEFLSLAVSGTSTVTLIVHRNGSAIYTTSDTSGSKLTSAGAAGLFTVAPDQTAHPDQFRALWAGAIGGPVGLTIAPGSAKLLYGGTQIFTVSPTFTNETFGWEAALGSISGSAATETYTAPTSGGPDTVTVTSVDLRTRVALASITLPFRAVSHRKGPSRRRKPMEKRLDFPLPDRTRR